MDFLGVRLYIMWKAARLMAISSEKTHRNSSSLGLLGKAYGMTLVAIVGVTAFVSKLRQA